MSAPMAPDERQVAESVADDERFEPLSGDDLERIEVVGAEEDEIIPLAQTAQFYRQEAMDLRDALREARDALEQAGFTHSAAKAAAHIARIDGSKCPDCNGTGLADWDNYAIPCGTCQGARIDGTMEP